MMNTKDIGNAGEQEATEFLTSKGYAIVDRQIVIGNVEVDILAMHGNRVVLIEVKTRKEDHLDENFAINRDKLFRLSRAGDSYVRSRNLPHEVQIDAILITNHRDGTRSIEHFEDIALPPRRGRRR